MSLKPSINWLLIFIPITLLLEHGGVTPPAVFFSAALSIVPAASLIARSTEQIATRTGDAVGGLLNATFGNLPEMIIAFVALKAGLFDMVRASIVGAILANLLLALGIAFFLGGLKYHDQDYNAVATRMYSSMMLIAVVSLAVPSAFGRLFSSQEDTLKETHLNLGLAALLLMAYVLYLVFMLKTHPEFFKGAEGGEEGHGHGKQWSLGKAIGGLVAASVLAAWMSEVLVGAAEETGHALGMSAGFIGIILLAILGGAAESGAAIAMARKDKMDLSVGIAMGSSIQIALFVTPVLVLSSRFVAPERLTLSFSRAEIGALFMGVLIGITLAGDGRANWFKGVQLVGFYLILAALFYLLPAAPA